MDTAIINIRTDLEIKEQAKKIAAKLGMSLSTVINVCLRKFVRTKGLFVSLEETPNAYLRGMLKESEEDIKAGRVVSFENGRVAIKYLDDMIKKDGKKN